MSQLMKTLRELIDQPGDNPPAIPDGASHIQGRESVRADDGSATQQCAESYHNNQPSIHIPARGKRQRYLEEAPVTIGKRDMVSLKEAATPAMTNSENDFSRRLSTKRNHRVHQRKS